MTVRAKVKNTTKPVWPVVVVPPFEREQSMTGGLLTFVSLARKLSMVLMREAKDKRVRPQRSPFAYSSFIKVRTRLFTIPCTITGLS